MTLPEPKRPTETHFYKYSGLHDSDHVAWLKVLILNHTIYLPSLNQLNDPADGRPVLRPLDEEKMLQFLFDANLNPTLTAEVNERNFEVLRYNIRFHGVKLIHREMTKLLNNELETYRIYSMSKRFDNTALWAKYADNHRGYCLEFANTGALFAKCVEVVYGANIPMDVTNPAERKGYFLYCKRPEWSNEEEVRVVRQRHSVGHDVIQPEWLTRIILGEAISGEHEGSIRQWCEERRPALTIVKAHFDYTDHTMKLSQPLYG